MQAVDTDKQFQLATLRQQLHDRRALTALNSNTDTQLLAATTAAQPAKPPLVPATHVKQNSVGRVWNGFGPPARGKSAQLSTTQVSSIVAKLAAQSPVPLDQTVVGKRIATYDSQLGLDDTDDSSDDSARPSYEPVSTPSTTTRSYIPTQRSSNHRPSAIQTDKSAIQPVLSVDVSPTINSPAPDTPAQPFSPSYGQPLDSTQQISNAEKRVRTLTDTINDVPMYRAAVAPHEVDLRVFVGTWNLHAKPVPENLADFIQPGYDVYAVGTEECENSIETSFVFTSKANWCKRVQHVLGSQYIEVGQQTLVAMHVIVYVRVDYAHLVSRIEVNSVATGIGDVMGNKGGVAVSFKLGYTSVCFVASHFQAHQNNVAGRNADFQKINTKLINGLANSAGTSPNMSDRFDNVFWCGDLNYRVHANRSIADTLLARSMMEVMLANDQLIHERVKRRVFNGFVEADITFPPTYKFDANSDRYDSSKKQRVQSWTDRILYKAHNGAHCVRYDSVRNIRSSDHRPVFATFKVRVTVSQPPSQTTLPTTDQTASATCTIQ